MKKLLMTAMVMFLAGCGGLLAEAEDPLAALLSNESFAGWQRTEPAATFNKDNVFELINGEAELYFPYGFKRVVATEYSGDGDMTVSVEAYELASLLDAYGVFSNYRDEESKTAQIGAEAVAGSTQVMFYQDRFFIKVRTNKTDQQEKLMAFARELAEALPQPKAPPSEPDMLDIKGVLPMSRQYIAQSVLGYEFFNKGMIAKAFLEENPPEGAKPLRVFVLREKSADGAAEVLNKYIAYLDKNQAPYTWQPPGARQVLKAEDPLHKGVLLKQNGPYIIGVAKLPPDADGAPLLERLEKKLPAPGQQPAQ